MKLGIAVLAVAFLCGCASNHPPAPRVAAKPRSLGPTSRGEAAAILARYRRERGCTGPAYGRAVEYAGSRLDQAASFPADAGHISDATESARFRVQLAEAAARKRCFAQARQTYLDVMSIFTGPPYASWRKRATTGLNRLPDSDS
jgi:hypothetical protein